MHLQRIKNKLCPHTSSPRHKAWFRPPLYPCFNFRLTLISFIWAYPGFDLTQFYLTPVNMVEFYFCWRGIWKTCLYSFTLARSVYQSSDFRLPPGTPSVSSTNTGLFLMQGLCGSSPVYQQLKGRRKSATHHHCWKPAGATVQILSVISQTLTALHLVYGLNYPERSSAGLLYFC